MLRRGFILVPEGAEGNVISFTPPLIIEKTQMVNAVRALKETITWAQASPVAS
jgi:4-aminobutyrate aminotransferase-like enzyme